MTSQDLTTLERRLLIEKDTLISFISQKADEFSIHKERLGIEEANNIFFGSIKPKMSRMAEINVMLGDLNMAQVIADDYELSEVSDYVRRIREAFEDKDGITCTCPDQHVKTRKTEFHLTRFVKFKKIKYNGVWTQLYMCTKCQHVQTKPIEQIAIAETARQVGDVKASDEKIFG